MGLAGPADSLLESLKTREELFSVELRPPRAHAPGLRSMDDWIDTYHSIRRLTVAGFHVFITDNAVGRAEEENLRHLVTNLGPDARRSHIVPFLTSKHPLDYCLHYAERAYEQEFRTLVVLGGDRHDGIPRCVEHAVQLRRIIRQSVPSMVLGGWANPHADPSEQADYLMRACDETDFFLTQVVSHHSAEAVERFLELIGRRQIEIPGIFGVFYYRSARKASLETLHRFFPVPAREIEREFEVEELHGDEVCARSIRKLRRLGVRRFYVSNLPVADAAERLQRIIRLTLAAEGQSSG
jgi:5,10-methylenetetrahydrofolate reductase